MVNNGTPSMMSSNISSSLAQGVNKTASFYNQNFQPTNSILANKWQRVTSINDTIKIQYNPFNPIADIAQNPLKNIIGTTPVDAFNVQTLPGTTGTQIALILASSGNTSKFNVFALPYIAIYVGTQALTVNQIYPSVAGTQPYNLYNFQGGGFDYDALINTNPIGYPSVWSMSMYNNQTTVGTFLVALRWKYINYTKGSTTNM